MRLHGKSRLHRSAHRRRVHRRHPGAWHHPGPAHEHGEGLLPRGPDAPLVGHWFLPGGDRHRRHRHHRRRGGGILLRHGGCELRVDRLYPRHGGGRLPLRAHLLAGRGLHDPRVPGAALRRARPLRAGGLLVRVHGLQHRDHALRLRPDDAGALRLGSGRLRADDGGARGRLYAGGRAGRRRLHRRHPVHRPHRRVSAGPGGRARRSGGRVRASRGTRGRPGKRRHSRGGAPYRSDPAAGHPDAVPLGGHLFRSRHDPRPGLLDRQPGNRAAVAGCANRVRRQGLLHLGRAPEEPAAGHHRRAGADRPGQVPRACPGG